MKLNTFFFAENINLFH